MQMLNSFTIYYMYIEVYNLNEYFVGTLPHLPLQMSHGWLCIQSVYSRDGGLYVLILWLKASNPIMLMGKREIPGNKRIVTDSI